MYERRICEPPIHLQATKMSFRAPFRHAMSSTRNSVLTAPCLQQTITLKSPSRSVKRMAGVQTVALSQDELKQQAAWKAVEYVKSGMAIGLGTGSTAAFAVSRIGELLKDGTLKDIVAVPTSIRTYEQAKSTAPHSASMRLIPHLLAEAERYETRISAIQSHLAYDIHYLFRAGLGIPLATLAEQPKLAVVIDGADEVDPQLDVVKGRGGALLREKASPNNCCTRGNYWSSKNARSCKPTVPHLESFSVCRWWSLPLTSLSALWTSPSWWLDLAAAKVQPPFAWASYYHIPPVPFEANGQQTHSTSIRQTVTQ